MHDDDDFLEGEETIDPDRPGPCWKQEYIELLTLNEMAHGAFVQWEKEQNYWLIYGPDKFTEGKEA